MNWYLFKKLAQVWNVPTDGTFRADVSRVYELEYKRALIKNNGFSGMDKRRDNIINQIELELAKSILAVEEPLKKTFETWLASHAITNQEEWAEARVKGGDDGSTDSDSNQILDALNEYSRYAPHSSLPKDNALQKILSKADQRPQDFPNLSKLLDIFAEDRRMYLYDELTNGIERFNEDNGTAFSSENDAEEWIESQNAETLNISLSDSISDTSELIQIAENLGIERDIAKDLYSGGAFEVWYDHWGPRGIDETRETVEKVYQLLLNAKTIDQKISSVNAALNCSHQTGSMLDHLQNYGNLNEEIDSSDMKKHLQSLTDGVNNEDWENHMRQTGVKVPQRKQLIQQSAPEDTSKQDSTNDPINNNLGFIRPFSIS